jgi:ribosomal protein L11 methyltransferase
MHNPFAQTPQPQQITVEGAANVLDIIELMAEDEAWAITRPINPSSPQLVLFADPAKADALIAMAERVGEQQQAPLKIDRLQLEPIDWVKQVQKDFPAFTLGRFYVHGSHVKEPPPKNTFPLLIDAAAAFGTGEHATTAGCLLALERTRKHRAYVPELLDMGCGTAILAIGGAYLWPHARIAACDNDAVAVEVSAVNLKANRVANRSHAWVSNGYRHARVRRKQYDVIVANILAKPLMRMARDAVPCLKPGGTLILSGLLNHQEAMVLSAHRAQGLYLSHRLRRGKWSVLVLKKH